jgi:hypothetical protein
MRTYLVITPTHCAEFFCKFRAAEYARKHNGVVES